MQILSSPLTKGQMITALDQNKPLTLAEVKTRYEFEKFKKGSFVHSASPASQGIATGLTSIKKCFVYVPGTNSLGSFEVGVDSAVAGSISGIGASGGTITVIVGFGMTIKWFAYE